jgi:hypothetical protein
LRKCLAAQGYSTITDWIAVAQEAQRVYEAKLRQQLEEQHIRKLADLDRQRAECIKRRQEQAAACKWCLGKGAWELCCGGMGSGALGVDGKVLWGCLGVLAAYIRWPALVRL